MAAVDLPLNDSYLSAIYEARNARKQQERKEKRMASSKSPTTSQKGAEIDPASASSIDVRASDTAILTQYPTSFLRLLVLLSPVISLAARFVRLMTWSGGPGTASHSFLLVLGWWATCLYGYEMLRYAPQAAILSTIGFNGLKRAFKGTSGVSSAPSGSSNRIVSSDVINATLSDLTLLADFSSTLASTILAPLSSMLNWGNPSETRGFAIFLLTSWPLWLLCFSRDVWDFLGLPRVGLGLGSVLQNALKGISSTLMPHVTTRSVAYTTVLREKSPALFQHWDAVNAQLVRASVLYSKHFSPLLTRIWYRSMSGVARSTPTGLTIVPLFPLFSLSVRHLLLVLGTIVLTWCSPWAALVRHALWRSALVRRSTRRIVAILSGSANTYNDHFARNLSQLPENHDPFSVEPTSLSNSSIDKSTAKKSSRKDVKMDEKRADGNVTRHEDVVYQFTVFENQRWWVGLDWTAALLPQERPSWSDESNNPVSPPSSFSLPPAKITIKPTPTSSNPNAHTRRLVRWQWIDPEWTVAGRDGFLTIGSPRSLSSPDTSAHFAHGQGRSPSETLFSSSSPTVQPEDGTPVEGIRRRESTTSIASSADALPSDLTLLDVDPEGWQYGDNGWEKMSRKAGMGRYTRRRRWIRRAVLVEIVERDYTPAPEDKIGETVEGESQQSHEVEPGHSAHEKSESQADSSAVSPRGLRGGSEIAMPASPRSGDLKQRLARAAQASK